MLYNVETWHPKYQQVLEMEKNYNMALLGDRSKWKCVATTPINNLWSLKTLDHKYYTKYRIKRHMVLLITLIMNKFTSIVIPTYF